LVSKVGFIVGRWTSVKDVEEMAEEVYNIALEVGLCIKD